MDNTDIEIFKAEKRLCHAKADTKYLIIRFGDHIAEREGYKTHRGIDAVIFYLVQKYHWTPSVVRNLTSDDLGFLLAEELSGWTLPEDAVV